MRSVPTHLLDAGLAPDWCPGCGNHTVALAVGNILERTATAHSDTVFICGPGCSSALTDLLGVHRHIIQPNAIATATRTIAAVRPHLDLWVLLDTRSAGHAGDLWPLVEAGTHVTCLILSPRSSATAPACVAAGAFSTFAAWTANQLPEQNRFWSNLTAGRASTDGLSFLARTDDTDSDRLTEVLSAAHGRTGPSLVEIQTACPTLDAPPPLSADEPFGILHDAGLGGERDIPHRPESDLQARRDGLTVILHRAPTWQANEG